MKRFEKHVFVCENRREPGNSKGCCASKGGQEFREKLKQKVQEAKIAHLIRINSAGCLDACEHGVAMVIYPEQIWYGGVTESDIDEIVKSHFIEGVPVDRLKIADKKFNKDLNNG